MIARACALFSPISRTGCLFLALCGLILLGGIRNASAGESSDETAPWRFRVGLATVGVRHLDVVGVGITGEYRHPLAWRGVQSGGEALLIHSGERRIPTREACNDFFLDDTAYVSHVYEQVGSVAIGGSLYVPVLKGPDHVGFRVPGVMVGLAGGFMFETDRVGLQSSDIQAYYGYSTPSDTDISLRPYVRPQIVLMQGGFSLSGSAIIFPRFARWTLGVAYAW